MEEQDIPGIVNSLSEALVLAEPSDLQTLASMHTQCGQVAEWARNKGLGATADCCGASAKLLESIILGEVADPVQVLGLISKVAEALQGIVRDGRGESEVTFPLESLGVGVKAQAAPPDPDKKPPTKPSATSKPPARSRRLEGDQDLLSEFVSEAQEHLDNADVHLLTIESNPSDSDALNAVFRAFHTIKGVAGFLALEDIQALAHESENLLDKARKTEISLTGGNIDVTFEAIDFMKRLVQHVSNALTSGAELPVEDELPALVTRIKSAASQSGEPPEGESLAPSSGHKLGEILVDAGLATKDVVEKAVLYQKASERDCHLGELLIREVVITRAQLEQALELQQERETEKQLGDILVEMGAARLDDIERALAKQEAPQRQVPVGEILVQTGEVDAKDVALALRAQKQKQAPMEVKEAVKVDADRLDRLIDLIGELVIAESMVCQSIETLSVTVPHLSRQISQLDKITRELQEMGMSLRMVPVRGTFQKMARLVRDLAKKSGKRIEFVSEGEDTELDKTVVDKIGDPLVHMVRNSCDHGLEASPEDRRRAGKPEVGHVTLRAFHKGGSIYVEIEDDGRGLDRDAILAKAREKGLVRDGDAMSDREVWSLIFEPGFSTAKVVTDVSGRGVGMDVVRKNIESLRGQVEIQSVAGKGSIFSIRLPLTLAIIEGMVIRAGRERFIVPTLSVVRSIQPHAGQVTTVVGRGEMLTLQGELIPLFRLHRIFSLSGAIEDPYKALVMIVENEGRKVGLMIDALVGQQQIVIKSLGQAMQELDGIAGGAIMSDGTVGLILDVGGLVTIANTYQFDVPKTDTRNLKEAVAQV
ncbi:MAG: chemotaxis protein CheA [Candidatus Hydrogenedentes bacterium]|nr:chemotaxis protein CheA [Candidatus Hydrogenedentota bacterium]